MSDEPRAPQPSEPENTGSTARGAMGAATSALTSGERTLAVGALLILIFPYFLGDILFDDYGVAYVELLMCVAALALINTVRMRGGSVPIPYGFSLRTLGYAMGVGGVFEILWFIDGNRVQGFGVVAALLYFVGVGAMVAGARQITD